MEMTDITVSTANESLPVEASLNCFLPTDLDADEDEILRRYESCYKSFIYHDTFQPLTRRYTEKDHVQDSLIDFCTSHALQGADYIEQIQMNLQYTVLQSALILTISMPLYIDPPGFNEKNFDRAFSAIIGLAAFSQLTVIIGCTIISALLNRPYTTSDTMVARVQAQSLLVFVNIINYVANVATLVAMLIAGFNRSSVDGGVQMYIGALVILLAYLAHQCYAKGSRFQDGRTLAFYNKYCDDNGRLKHKYLLRVYEKN
jgi:hypothetical protein